MDYNRACHILKVRQDMTMKDIKKSYHKLMLMTHPDMGRNEKYPYDAKEINVAYEFLVKFLDEKKYDPQKDLRQTNTAHWNAPLNMYAYQARPIYHYVEDSCGQKIGTAFLGMGKYMWTEEEDFSLFLKSLYEAAREILRNVYSDKAIYKVRERELLPPITYLLSQQYVDSSRVLGLLAKSKDNIYHIDAMLELTTSVSLKMGQILYPVKLSNHRLYVGRQQNEAIGYLSFKDDRLYYGIIPLFERRSMRVKMHIADEKMRRVKGKRYRNVHLSLIYDPENKTVIMENINEQIDRLLHQERRE